MATARLVTLEAFGTLMAAQRVERRLGREKMRKKQEHGQHNGQHYTPKGPSALTHVMWGITFHLIQTLHRPPHADFQDNSTPGKDSRPHEGSMGDKEA